MNELARFAATVTVSVVSSAAVCIWLTSAPLPPQPPEVDWSRIDRLEARLHDLETAPRVQTAALPAPEPAPAAHDREPVPKVDGAAVRAALLFDVLEERLRFLEERTARGGEVDTAQSMPKTPTKAEAAKWILDPAADSAQKLRAHEAMRSVADGYTPAMVAELIRMGTTDQNGAVRADVWRFFDGKSRFPQIVAPLVRALVADADATAREEAADTLGSYLDDPVVEPALRRAAEGDASERVRAKAKRTLTTRRSFAPLAERE